MYEVMHGPSARHTVMLPNYVHERASIQAVYPHRCHLAPEVRAFIDFLVEKLTPVPPWAEG